VSTLGLIAFRSRGHHLAADHLPGVHRQSNPPDQPQHPVAGKVITFNRTPEVWKNPWASHTKNAKTWGYLSVSISFTTSFTENFDEFRVPHSTYPWPSLNIFDALLLSFSLHDPFPQKWKDIYGYFGRFMFFFLNTIYTISFTNFIQLHHFSALASSWCHPKKRAPSPSSSHKDQPQAITCSMRSMPKITKKRVNWV